MEVISLKYFIGENGSTGREFDSIQDFLDAIADLAQTHEENGEEWFEIQVVNDQEDYELWKRLKETQMKI